MREVRINFLNQTCRVLVALRRGGKHHALSANQVVARGKRHKHLSARQHDLVLDTPSILVADREQGSPLARAIHQFDDEPTIGHARDNGRAFLAWFVVFLLGAHVPQFRINAGFSRDSELRAPVRIAPTIYFGREASL